MEANSLTPIELHVTEIPTPQRHRENFSPEEDDRLRQLVSRYGPNDWSVIAGEMPNRTSRQCRERWRQYLSPDIVASEWTQEEDRQIVNMYLKIGPKWTQISQMLSNRTPISVKNRLKQLQRRVTRQTRNIPIKAENRLDGEMFHLILQTMLPPQEPVQMYAEEQHAEMIEIQRPGAEQQ